MAVIPVYEAYAGRDYLTAVLRPHREMPLRLSVFVNMDCFNVKNLHCNTSCGLFFIRG